MRAQSLLTGSRVSILKTLQIYHLLVTIIVTVEEIRLLLCYCTAISAHAHLTGTEQPDWLRHSTTLKFHDRETPELGTSACFCIETCINVLIVCILYSSLSKKLRMFRHFIAFESCLSAFSFAAHARARVCECVRACARVQAFACIIMINITS